MARILIAEDETDIRNLIVFTLEFAGHHVTSTRNGQEAIQAIRGDPPDLILLDVRMPRMTGYEVCARVKQDPDLSSIPVVFLSAKSQEKEIQAGLDLGASKYLLKPFSPDDLTSHIQEILDQKNG